MNIPLIILGCVVYVTISYFLVMLFAAHLENSEND